ncbi:hypothetical protein [Streptomyces sp. 6N223]|uniref:hypothetical protein n=1 Tax=Streptomyces sp. 6N223 TaxID=3457412 RepID=UPI003FD4B569
MAGDRLPTPPRERKPALAALAALLVLVGALGATLLVLRAGERIEAIKITEEVPAGQPIPDDAIESVMVADNTGVAYVEWSQRDQLDDFRAATDLVEGSVLVGKMLTTDAGIPEGQALVGVNLQPGHYPPGLEVGDTVDVLLVGDAATEEEPEGTVPEPVLVSGARVTEIFGEDDEVDGNSALALQLRVDVDAVPSLARAAAEDAVSVAEVAREESN